MTPTDRETKIRELAYRLWQQQGSEAGYPLQNWLEAEKQVDAADAKRRQMWGVSGPEEPEKE